MNYFVCAFFDHFLFLACVWNPCRDTIQTKINNSSPRLQSWDKNSELKNENGSSFIKMYLFIHDFGYEC